MKDSVVAILKNGFEGDYGEHIHILIKYGFYQRTVYWLLLENHCFLYLEQQNSKSM